MSASDFVTLLDKWHIPHKPYKASWATHNRKGHGEWGPVHGIGVHHTGSDGNTGDQNSTLWNGLTNLPGPLCHGGIAIDGTVHLIGWGRANHFGLGSSRTLQHVISEDYKGNLTPGAADTDGNSRFYGFEIHYSGSHSMSDKQRQTMVRVCAAICTHHGWHAESTIGHGEWQQGKWDPGFKPGTMMSMASFRNEVRQAIAEGPTKPPTPAKPKPPAFPAYTVKKGDTLGSIAKYDAKVADTIIALNPSLLDMPIGKVLRMPKG